MSADGVSGIEQWWADGARVTLDGREIFVRRFAGTGERHLTLLHGFPSSSHDYAKVVGRLTDLGPLLLPDFLGHGASEKPQDHAYSIHEQADLVSRLWERDGVEDTWVVAHDYAVSVAQELLARRHPAIRGVVFLNGGVYPDLHRPLALQLALLDPEEGPNIGPMMTEGLFVVGAETTFGEGYDHVADATDIWASIARDDGQLVLYRLIHYIRDRERHGERWVAALEDPGVPIAFAWGMLDPISGAHIAERIRQRLPGAPFTPLDDVGHWPPLEAPDRVAAAIRSAVTA
jgi:pimeloyl-ACP methyl ester carboxylesterase